MTKLIMKALGKKHLSITTMRKIKPNLCKKELNLQDEVIKADLSDNDLNLYNKIIKAALGENLI